MRPCPHRFRQAAHPVRRDGQPARVSLDQASVEGIRAATRALRGKPRPSGGAGEPPATAALRDIGAPDVKVQVARDKVSLSGIPLSALAKTLRALAAVKVPQ
ncbi:hypothetical protein [Sorangium sp. So ce341]|uniref:hypothetical protein n=1 Tax=Sorangium sp. So ce341 TaxID=3133302 RepID=UPI003F5F6079